MKILPLQQSLASLLVLLIIAFTGGPLVVAQTTAPSSRAPEAITADLQSAMVSLQAALQGGHALQSPELRKKAGPEVVASVDKILSLMGELAAAQPQAKAQLDQVAPQFRTLALIFDDPQQTALANQLEAGNDGQAAARAKASIAVADYVKATEEGGQLKALDAFDAALKTDSTDPVLVSLVPILSMAGSPSANATARLLTIMKNDAQGPEAQQLAQELESDLKQKQMENKPLVIEGATLDNGKLSTTSWKGKVILIDFWATWCGPCREELPRVKQMYSDYHAKGLEVLGISCDNATDDLKQFLAQNPDMPWPQIFDQTNPGWSPIATSYGIVSIPTMYLIDRKGILRTVSAREQLEDLIPKLLAEAP